MSWDAYIDSILTNSEGNADMACIIGLDGSKWTTDEHRQSLYISSKEIHEVCTVMLDMEVRSFQENGIWISGTRYHYLRKFHNMVFGKLTGKGAVTLQKTKCGLVIAHTPENKRQAMVNLAVHTVADYLESLDM